MITYRVGDASTPPERPAVIAHVVNDVGAWGAGFSGALGGRFPPAELSYRQWFQGLYAQVPGADAFGLGKMLIINPDPTDSSLYVAHLCAQRGVGIDNRRIQHDALRGALARLYNVIAAEVRFTIHMPHIGWGLGGGNWWEVQRIVEQELPLIHVFVYSLPGTLGDKHQNTPGVK